MNGWYCVRSVVTDGSGHSIVDTDVMPGTALRDTLHSLAFMYGVRAQVGGVTGHQRWTWATHGPGNKVRTEMIIASEIGV